MNLKIENENTSEKGLSGFELNLVRKPWMLITVIIICSIMFSAIFYWASSWVNNQNIGLFTLPGAAAGGIVILNGIEEFSGNLIENGWKSFHTVSLFSILSLYLTLPIFFIFIFFKWKRTSYEEREKVSIRKTLIVLIALCSVFLSFIATRWSIYVGNTLNQKRLLYNSQLSCVRDILISYTNNVAMDAKNFFYLPRNLGGGEGRWRNILAADGKVRNYSLPEKFEFNGIYFKRVEATLNIKPEPFKVLLDPIENDTLLTIRGMSERAGTTASFRNADGRSGRQQVSVNITPNTLKLLVDN